MTPSRRQQHNESGKSREEPATNAEWVIVFAALTIFLALMVALQAHEKTLVPAAGELPYPSSQSSAETAIRSPVLMALLFHSCSASPCKIKVSPDDK